MRGESFAGNISLFVDGRGGLMLYYCTIDTIGGKIAKEHSPFTTIRNLICLKNRTNFYYIGSIHIKRNILLFSFDSSRGRKSSTRALIFLAFNNETSLFTIFHPHITKIHGKETIQRSLFNLLKVSAYPPHEERLKSVSRRLNSSRGGRVSRHKNEITIL